MHTIPAKIAFSLVFTAIVIGAGPLSSGLLNNEYYGLIVDETMPDFTLEDSHGTRHTQADFEGQWVFLMFGFLRCSDVCHAQALVLEELSRHPGMQDVQFVYLAMDALRDEPSALRRYFDQRGKNFISLHADTIQEMQTLSSDFNAPFRLRGTTNSPDFVIEHPARIFLLNPQGNIRIIYTKPNANSFRMAEDFRRISST